MAEEFLSIEQATGVPEEEDDIISVEQAVGQAVPEAPPSPQLLSPEEALIPDPEKVDTGSPMVNAILDYVQERSMQATGAADAALNVGSNIVGAMAGGLSVPFQAAYTAVTGGDLGDVTESVTDTFNSISSAIAVDPITERGKTYSSIVMTPFEMLSEGGEIIGDKTFEETGSAELATLARITPEALAYLILPGLFKARAKTKARPRPVTTRDGTTETTSGEVTVDFNGKKVTGTVDDIVITGDAPLPGAPYRAAEMSAGGLKKILPEEAVMAPEAMYQYTREVLDGTREPAIIVEAINGKITKVLEGEAAAQIMIAGGEKAIPVRVVERPRATTPEIVKKDSAAVKRYYDNLDAALLAQEDTIIKRLDRFVKEGFIDTAYEVRARLLDSKNEAGKSAVIRLDNINGAPARAQQIFIKAEKNIYTGLKRKDKKTLDRIVASRRIHEVDKFRGTGVVKHGEGLTGGHHANFVRGLQEEIGMPKYTELNRRADAYFESTNEAFVKLFDEGLIDKKLFNTLKNVDYSLTKYIDIIDPVRSHTIGGKKITVHDSGIERFKGGSTSKIMELDSRELLAQTIGRVEARIAKNTASKALAEYAKKSPDNGWVGVGKGAKKRIGLRNPSVIEYVEGGKTKKIYMDEVIAEEWVSANPMMSYDFANMVRLFSGSLLVRPAATGYNPAFALVNMPRDLVHIWMSTGEYSSIPYLTALQMSKDLSVTAFDTFRRKGRYDDFLEEGGGMNFLSHQGREIFTSEKFATSLEPKMNSIKKAFGYLNETSEIWTRLMLRERALRNIKKKGGTSTLEPATEATWVARSYLDFSRGGKYSKAIDNAIPYFNAANQAFRGVAREAKTHPGRFAMKAGWLMTIDAQLFLANYLINPEAWSQVPDEIRRDYWIITTPFYTTDAEGYKRHMYFRFRKDNSITPITSVSQSLMARSLEGRTPNTKTLDTIKSAIPFVQGTVPSMEALYTYAANKDFYTDRQIWKDAPGTINPQLEYYTGEEPGLKERTPWLYRAFGELANASPERSKAAGRKVLPRNDYLDIVGAGMQTLMDDIPPGIRDKVGDELLSNSFMLRSVISLTHPAATEFERLEDPAREARSEVEMWRRRIDTVYTRSREGVLEGGDKTVEALLREAPSALRESMKQRFLRNKKLDIVMRRFDKSSEDLSRGTWLNMSSQTPMVRAKLFYEEWKDASSTKRNKMQRMAGALTAAGAGFNSTKFRAEFIRLQKKYGK